jgi:hypothetical protein
MNYLLRTVRLSEFWNVHKFEFSYAYSSCYSFKQALNMYLMKVQLFRCVITHRMTLGVLEAIVMVLFLRLHLWHPQKLLLLLRLRCWAKYFKLGNKLHRGCSSLSIIKGQIQMGLMQSCHWQVLGNEATIVHRGRGAPRGWCLHQGPRGHVFHLYTALLRRK